MARRSEDERKTGTSHYHDRNRTFSSTTTNHYRNKLAQIGIQKDLREILERKKLEKELLEHEKDNVPPSKDSSNEASQLSRKVRFVDERAPLRRSKSFTSGTYKNYDYDQRETETIKEKSPPKKFNKSFKGKRKDFFDLQNPANIKIELKTESGERKCVLDENVSLVAVKCDLRNCRNVLNHSENKTKPVPQENTLDKTKVKNKTQNFSRNGEKSRSFNKKNRGPNEKYTPKKDEDNTQTAPENVPNQDTA